MKVRADDLLAWAAKHESEPWETLRDGAKFSYRVIDKGIEYTPASSNQPRPVRFNELADFCTEFERLGSFAPGQYPSRWHKSYTLPLIKRFLSDPLA